MHARGTTTSGKTTQYDQQHSTLLKSIAMKKTAISRDTSHECQMDKTRQLPPNAGQGRKRGVPNKISSDVKHLVLIALDLAGGEDYLTKQAHENPVAFLSLLSKLIPRDAGRSQAEGIKLEVITGV